MYKDKATVRFLYFYKKYNVIMNNNSPFLLKLINTSLYYTVVVSVVDVLFSISSEKSLSLFKCVVDSKNNNDTISITKLGLTSKEFYSTIKKLIDVGLVERINGKYQITSLGEIVLNAQAKVETAIKYYWELKAIDSIISRYRELPPKECQHIIDNIIDNDEIKEMLVSKNSYNKSTSTALANTAYQQTH
jgi:predicted transcriptional regulator